MPKAEEQDFKDMEKETVLFHGKSGNVTWNEFEKSIARYFRMKFGSEIGNQLWRNELPIIDGDEAIGRAEFKEHCQEVLEAIANHSPQKYAIFKPQNSGFWEVAWHIKWRQKEWARMIDVVSMRCRGQALLTIEELAPDNYAHLRRHLIKHYGGASEDVRQRELHFDAGMPDKPGGKPFPKGIDIEAKLQSLKSESVELTRMCPLENRGEYEYAKEKTLVKMIIKHLQQTEYAKTIKELLQEMKVERMVKRRIEGGGNANDPDEVDIDDWEHRNYKDSWLPSFERLKTKLISHYKERKFQSNQERGGDNSRSLPSMVNKIIDGTVKVMLAPAFGLKPKGRNEKSKNNGKGKRERSKSRDGKGKGGVDPEPKCWACGLIGHRSTDSICKAEPGTIHESAPKRARFDPKSNKDNGKNRTSKPICKFYQDTGKCKFGAKCRFVHDQNNGSNLKGLSQQQKSSIKSFKIGIQKQFQKSNDIDTIVNQFLVVRTIPRECDSFSNVDVTCLSTVLVDESSFAFDTGSGEGISVHRKDFVYLDESEEAKNSVLIQGPSVGAPLCIGRGPLVFRFELDGKPMGLVSSKAILANVPSGGSIFRLVSAIKMKRQGVRYVAGMYNEPDRIECVRSGLAIPTSSTGDVLFVQTTGFAEDIVPSEEFKDLVFKISNGLESPLVDLSPYLKDSYVESGEKNRKYAQQEVILNVEVIKNDGVVKAMLMNETKLSDDERARLYCRRLGYIDTRIFATMASKSEFGNFPKLKVLNEDNIGSDLAKHKRGAYKRNDPEEKLVNPPWWSVQADGYGGQNSMGAVSEEGASGAYLFTCLSTGSTDIRLYASHYQFPIALHQFLVRVQAEFWTCRVIYMDTHSVNLSKDVEEVLALFQVQLVPISAGTPQELAFAETRVKMIRRMSTAMLIGAPHLGKKFWALTDRHAVFVADFLPQSTRKNVSSYYLRTGRQIDWTQLGLKVFGAPLVFAPIDGPIHKRAPINEEGYFLGYQWPAMLVLRKSDGKVISVSRQKVRVYESAYTGPLNQRMIANAIESEFNANDLTSENDPATEVSNEAAVFEGETVQSIKALRDHNLKLPGRNYKDGTDIEESARYGNVETFREGLYFDDVLSTPMTELAGRLEENARNGLTLKEALIKSIKETTKGIQRMSLRKGKKSRDDAGISTSNIMSQKRGKKGVTFETEPEAIFNEGKAIMGLATSKVKEKDGSKMRKIANEFSEGDIPNVSMEPSPETIFDDAETIIGQDKVKHLPKGQYESGKMHKKFSGPKYNQDWTTAKAKQKRNKAIGKHKAIAKVGDLISVPAELFDSTPGSYSKDHPERCFGTVSSIDKKGVAKVIWVEDGSSDDCKLRDLIVEKRKFTSGSIVAMLIEGDKVAFAPKDINDWPKDFFEVLVRSDWRKWVEAVKKEIEGWDDNRAVELVNIEDVPATAKIIPLGELYTIKRNGTYKFRQYLMGNLLRPGIDFQDNYSTTISATGTTIFFSLAATSRKMVHGWDAVCGYLQTKEQYDIYCYLPSHEGYSKLEYEEIAELRKAFLKILETEGMAGIKRFARNHRKQYRANPKQVYKCNSSIYGNLSAGAEFEKLMHHAHIQVCGMTQTQPEPSMFVKIKVDENDIVIGYLIVIAFVDDVRMFGTDPELQEYKSKIASCMKVKFDELPVPEFVGIQTYQNLEKGLCELKMPNYWNKAKTFFQQFRNGEFKNRKIPLSVLDETAILTNPTSEEIEEAKNLPYLQAVGILSYPASQCKFEIKYAVSLVGSRRTGWSKKHFDIVLKIFEYALTTCEMGLIYSSGLDPHGVNVIYGYADANHRVPRSQGSHTVMMNGAATSFVSKKQTKSAPSTTAAESTSLFQCTTDVLGVRNLMTELGMHQEYPTVIYQDNKSTIQIANNRGSLGKSSRAMDLEVLTTRNRIEDHQVSTEYADTDNMLADIGTKALTLPKFPRFRDTMNGYALVKAKYPDLNLPDYVYQISDEDKPDHKRGSKLERVQSMIMDFQYVKWDEDDADDEEEEEDGDDDDTVNENSMPEEGSSDVNHDNTTQVVLHLNDDTSQEGNWNEDAAYDHGGEYQHDDVRYKTHPLIQLNQHYEYDPDNAYSMKLPLMLYEPGTIEYIEEIDNLPDPRIYGINVEMLNMYVLLYLANPTRPHPFHLYEQYMRHVDPVQKEYQVTVEWAWTVLHTEAEKHKATPCLLSDPNLIIKYLPPFLSTDPHLRSRQIMIVMERYIRQIEPHFHQHLDKAYRDNVEWDYFTKSPTPKASFLRWCRWKCYFVNRYHRYMDRDNLDALSPIDDLPEGPPNWRDVDELRTQHRNWFIMDSVTSQYKQVPCGFQDDVIPKDDDVELRDIVFWEQIPLWKRGPYGNFLPLTRIWNNCANDQEAEHLSHRHTRLTAFLQRPDSKWGSVAQKNGISTYNPWGIQPQSQPETAQDHGWGKQEATNSKDKRTSRNVEVVDVSEDDEEQDPPPPKKPKVVHESSDDRNLGS